MIDLAELIDGYRLVIRPSILGGFVVGKLKAVTLGGHIILEPGSSAEGKDLEETILRCLEKIRRASM